MSERTRKVRTDKWEPTEKDLDNVELYASIGLPLEKIASLLRISKSTLMRRLREDSIISDTIKYGRSKAEANVSAVALKMASSGNNTQMTKYWLNCRAGWSEDKVEESKFGAPPKDPTLEDDDEII